MECCVGVYIAACENASASRSNALSGHGLCRLAKDSSTAQELALRTLASPKMTGDEIGC
jgi:hypothetical protein